MELAENLNPSGKTKLLKSEDFSIPPSPRTLRRWLAAMNNYGRGGLVDRIDSRGNRSCRMGPEAIDGRSIHDVLKFIERSFDTIDKVPEGHVHLAKAAEKTHVTIQAILEMLFGLHLKTARLLVGKHGFSGVMVSPTEIMECIADPPEDASDEIRFWMP